MFPELNPHIINYNIYEMRFYLKSIYHIKYHFVIGWQESTEII